jgi:DinB superfamily
MVAVHPPLVEFLSQERADGLAREGLFADEPQAMAAAWPRIRAMWEATVAGARERPPWQLDERVDGEWSFIETQRHLVHVTDVWVRDVIEEAESPYHPWGMPPDFAQGRAGDLGLTLDARPSLDEVLALRHERAAQVGRVVDRLDDRELHRTCRPRDGRFTVVGALQTVMFEEWAHHRYATRDLARLDAGATGG